MGFPITPSGVLLQINCPGGTIPPGLLRFYTLTGTFVPIFTAGIAPNGGCSGLAPPT